MKRGNIILLIFLLVAAAGGFVVASVLHGGLSARATPTSLEAMMARNARHMAIPSGARNTPNPVRTTDEVLHEACLHFADHCASCHGNDGSGDTMYGRGLYPKPPDLRLADTQKLSDGELFWVIENGVRFTGMPAFASPGSANDSWKLVDLIRHLPKLTTDEKMEMERYNPKGPDDRKEEEEEDNFLDGATPAPKPESHHH